MTVPLLLRDNMCNGEGARPRRKVSAVSSKARVHAGGRLARYANTSVSVPKRGKLYPTAKAPTHEELDRLIVEAPVRT